MNTKPPFRDIPRITLAVLFIGLMIVACLWILKPFLAAGVWAVMVVVATWPLMLAVEARAGGRRWVAVTVMTLAMLVLLVMPIVAAVSTIVRHANDISGWVKALASADIPQPPAWVEHLPLVGSRIADRWRQIAGASHDELAAQAIPYVRRALQWFAGRAGGFGLLLLDFLLIVVMTAVLYATGETAARGVRRFARRLAGDRGDDSVVLAGQAIRAVALGVVVTAIIQSAVAGVGLAVCGIPFAPILTAITFVLCIAQLGPILVMAPAVGWLYWSGDVVWGTVLLVWTLVAASLDNVLRPVLIRRGADLPLLLIFAGVIGGLFGFGVVGLFVGPVVLAVSYRLLESWVADIDRDDGAPPLPASAPAPSRPSTQDITGTR